MKYKYSSAMIWSWILLIIFSISISAQNGVDGDTLLLLKFENNLNGEQGESSTQNNGVTFEAGISGQGVLVDGSDILRYATAGNFNASAGTIEFWVKPRWGGNDTSNRCLFGAGDSFYANGSMVFEKDGGKFLTVNVNVPHASTGMNVSNWAANQWHYVAYTWEYPGNVKIFVDGELKVSRPAVQQDIISPVPTMLSVGSINTAWQANAVIDELRVSSRPRATEEIKSRFRASLTINSISLNSVTTNLWKTWRIMPTVTAAANIGVINIPSSDASWSSSNPNVAAINAAGQIVALEAGTAVLTANLNGAQASLTVNVRAPVLQPRVNAISNYLQTPAAGSLYEIPVVMIRYLPTIDGVNLDPAYAPGFFTLDPVLLSVFEPRLDDYDKNIKFILEEGSRFRGYGSQTPTPSLGYRVVASITVYEPTPPGKVLGNSQGFSLYASEYLQIFERFGLENYVNNLGVKEIWFWQGLLAPNYPSFNSAIHLPENFREISESNMSSPTTGDISNSFRDNTDLPIYNKTYTVYGQNIRRSQAEAVHNHGHQLEALLNHSDFLQNGNNQFFWQKFVGRDTNFNWQRGRAGDTHHPPNVLNDYDYQNFTPFPSDIMDWKPDGGQTTNFSAATYSNIPYAFPAANPPQAVESKWYIFWFQSMPGRGNQIPFGTNRMTNWWHFTGNWDTAIRAGIGLYEPASCSYTLSANSQNFTASGGIGTVSVNAGSGCKWFASSNASWVQIASGENGNNGNTNINFTVSPNTSGNSRKTTVVIGGQVFNVTQSSNSKAFFDFDGDGKADISVFRPSLGSWYLLQSSNSSFFGLGFGLGNDLIVPADFDGDGKTDIAVFRPSNGTWYLQQSANGFTAVQFGQAGDLPVPADYDGDGKADIAVFRPSTGGWYRLNSSNGGFVGLQFGISEDKPTIGDFDGDGKADIAVFRPSTGSWYRLNSSNGQFVAVQFGIAEDKPVPADFDGDGKADIAVFRPLSGAWYQLNSSNGQFIAVGFGIAEDKPVAADYDGDGKADIAVFRPSTGSWYLLRSTAGFAAVQFGVAEDKPTPNAFTP